MKNLKLLGGLLVGWLLALSAQATTFYVDASNPAPVSPFNSWSTAATNIQDAIDVSTNGDLVLVTNGVYQYGGKVVVSDLTNRVVLNKAISVQSVNGPWVTTIQGAVNTNGAAAVRCAWLTNGASLTGFTLRFGATRASGGGVALLSGGGVWCASSNAMVNNCVLTANNANFDGSAVYQGTIRNCFMSGNSSNSSSTVGVVASVVMNSCTVVSNAGWGVSGGGILSATNCIIYYNVNAPLIGTFAYSCAQRTLSGVGNFTNLPQFFGDGIHLLTTSPCIGAGTNLVSGTDIFGQTWSNPPTIGCVQWQGNPLVTKPVIQLATNFVGFTVTPLVTGQAPLTFTWLKDGLTLSDDGHYSGSQTASLLAAGVNYTDVGNYQLVVSNASGVVTSAVAQLVVHCVDIAGTNPVAPYLNWATAATNIQDAITAVGVGEIILVTNGLYAVGGKSMDGTITNRVSVDKAILVQSVNGANNTIIQGAWDPTTTNGLGLGAVRCVWLTNNAVLSGFTLRGGATRVATPSGTASMSGGGVFGTSNNATLYNCVITANSAGYNGGGANAVTLNFCTLSANFCGGFAGAGAQGGGAANSNLRNCLVSANRADYDGGGVLKCKVLNSALFKNFAVNNGGAAYLGSLVNCTVISNTVTGNGNLDGAVTSAALTNCIVYQNVVQQAFQGASNYASCTFSYSDTAPLVSGNGNIAVDPQVLADSVHLAATSPCLGAGTATVISGADIDGQSWSNSPPMGCDEWRPAAVVSVPLVYQINYPNRPLTFSVVAAGLAPFTYFWSKDGTLVQDDGRYANSGTANMIVKNYAPEDGGSYQVVVSNAFGMATSQIAQIVIHGVNIAGTNPIAPYLTWATAATNIQDAINIAATGDIVLVTNGVYATGGKVVTGDLTNRVVLDKAITVTSVNGYSATIIQGARDPISTNGPGSVRCAYLADGALLSGFTLQNGSTRGAGDAFYGGPLQSGGGVLCSSRNATVANCFLTNNSATYGGGIFSGTLNNSFVVFNFGSGAHSAVLNNCMVMNNAVWTSAFGGGTHNSDVRNSLVFDNYYYGYSGSILIRSDNNYYVFDTGTYSYSCTYPAKAGTSNIVSSSIYQYRLDSYHLATNAPTRGAGSAAYASGYDLDGEPWASPPSMGCDEAILSNLVGALSFDITTSPTNVVVNRISSLSANLNGRASRVEWLLGGSGLTFTWQLGIARQWTNVGDYTVTFTAYNADNPAGVSTNLVFHVLPFEVPQMQSAGLVSNQFQFQFSSQATADYVVQTTTNLTAPVNWQTLQNTYNSIGGVIQITDTNLPSGSRFYRVLAQ